MNDHHLEPFGESRMSALIEEAIFEDLGMGDVTTDAVVPPDAVGRGEFLVKEPGIIAGIGVAGMVFQCLDPDIHFHPSVEDGARVAKGTIIAQVYGPLQGILKAERTALNFLQRMSGIATLTRTYVNAVSGTNAKITDTRKTAPGLRILDKYAVRMGGGVNHRFGLDDMVLIKDNHIVAAGSIAKAVDACRRYLGTRGFDRAIEVETKNLAEVDEALACTGLSRIMLDNFAVPDMRVAVGKIAHRVEVEASGGITLETVRPVAETGVDFISVGALTHSVKALDISLELTHA